MKKSILLMFAASVIASQAAVTLSGTSLKNVQGSAAADLVAGRLAIVIADIDGLGFLNNTVGATAGALTSANTSFSITSALAGLAIGSSFGGDMVVGRWSTLVAGDCVINASNLNLTDPATLSTKFAVIWFESLTPAGAPTSAPADSKFGIARGLDWTLPAANSGAYTFGTGTTATVYDQLTLSPASAPAGAGVGFSTAGTTFSIVPETSTALLGALGALGLLRRRR